MKKIVIALVVSLFASVIFTGCRNEKTYTFKQPNNKIVNIEIVEAESSLEYFVIKTLSEIEQEDFLEQFESIKFSTYLFGDPLSVHGNAVKITYQNDDYEIICYSWAEYVKNGKVYFIKRFCDKEVFDELLDSFLE